MVYKLTPKGPQTMHWSLFSQKDKITATGNTYREYFILLV